MTPRLRRLQADYEEIRERFSGHPHVVVEPIGEQMPPEAYRLTFNLEGLTLEGDQPVKRSVHHAEMSLPAKYPAVQPYVVPAEGEAIFHPNIANYFCIADYWWAGTKLSDIVVKLGDMIQWREVNPHSPLDSKAAQWALDPKNSEVIPVGRVDIGMASSGGDDLDVQVIGAEPVAPSGSDGTAGAAVERPVEVVDDVHEGDFELTILNSSVGVTDGSNDR